MCLNPCPGNRERYKIGKPDPAGIATHFLKDLCQVCHKTLISILILFVKSGS